MYWPKQRGYLLVNTNGTFSGFFVCNSGINKFDSTNVEPFEGRPISPGLYRITGCKLSCWKIAKIKLYNFVPVDREKEIQGLAGMVEKNSGYAHTAAPGIRGYQDRENAATASMQQKRKETKWLMEELMKG